VRVDKQKMVANAADTREPLQTKVKNMKNLLKLALTGVMLIGAVSAKADWVSGYVRSNGTYVAPYYRSSGSSLGSISLSSGSSRDYVYRNPSAAYPSVSVGGYTRSSGTYVPPHVRTLPNWTTTDNLNYRGYGTIRVPRYSSGW